MANQFSVAIVDSILSLFAQGWSQRRIARELRIDRETVARHVRLRGQSGAAPGGGATGGQPPGSDSKPAIVPTGSHPPTGRPCHCAPWSEFILAKRELGLSARRIHQDLQLELGVRQVGYDSVRRFLKRVERVRPLPFRRMECEPGVELQVDFGTGARIEPPNGKRRKTHVFRAVLSHSRKGYSEACFRQTTEDFIRCLENALWHFGGVPRTVVLDNLKAAVLHPDWFDPELNPKLRAFGRHYGLAILPTKPRMPRHKGKVERGVGYAQDNGLKGRVFLSLEEQNEHLAAWEATIADRRIHGTTKMQVAQRFEQAEKPALQPLPRERFPFFHERPRIVNRDGHIEVAKAYYSAPPEYVGLRVWARWDAKIVRIFNQRQEQIAVHARKSEGRFATRPEDLHPHKINSLESGAEVLLRRVACIGPRTLDWASAMLAARGIEGTRSLQGLLALGRKFQASKLEKACEIALSHGEYRLRTVRRLIGCDPAPQQAMPFLDEHPIIRPLADYDGVVGRAFQRQADRRLRGEGFLRHGWTEECSNAAASSSPKIGPVDRVNDRRGAAEIPPSRPGDPLSGCSPAEPDSVSPDPLNVLPFPSDIQERSHA